MRAAFLSDLHIDDDRPQVLAGLRQWIDAHAGEVDALYVLGDLAEVWVGDDDDGAAASAIRDALAGAAARCAVFVMRGNRDFLLGERFAADTGATLLPDPFVADIDGRKVLLAHGDAYCTGDAEYQRARALLRSSQWQAEVLARPLPARRALAADLRARSRAANERKADNIMDVATDAVAAAMADAGAALLVHGHTHRPGIHRLPEGRRRIVLGDWERCGWVLTLGGGEAELACFALPNIEGGTGG